MSERSFVVHAGGRAARHLRERGLASVDITCVPAAAGGPKGLALVPIDRRLFGAGGWLRERAQPLHLIGASIGAWRMMAAAQVDADRALQRLSDSYIAQRYPRNPPPQLVSDECRKLAQAVLDGGALPTLRAGAQVQVITTRARGVLASNGSRRAFVQAAIANARSRDRLAAHMQRVVFHASTADFPVAAFDPFGLQRVPFSDANAEDALLASGSIPLVCAPVRDPAGAPRGDYWDGGLIDYHLLLPYTQLDGLVLYPHFVPQVTAGWLDKFLPWRRHAPAHDWLANVLLVAPSPALLQPL